MSGWVKLRSRGSAVAWPVYLQHRTYLMSVGTAVECQEATSRRWLAWIDAREFDHFRPLLSFARNDLAEVGRRAGKHGSTCVGKNVS
jgi:hypothetical protein